MNKRFLRILKWITGILLSIFILITACLYLFKDKIIGIVVLEVNKTLNVPVAVRNVDLAFWGSFPNLSVDFNEVYIQDAFPNQKPKDTLLYSERIRLKFNPIDLWNKNYHVKAVQIYPGTLKVKINSKGEGNYNILKSDSTAKNEEFELKLKSIYVEDFRVSYTNKSNRQQYSTTISESEFSGDFSAANYRLIADGAMLINKAKSGQVTFIKNKTLDYNFGIDVNGEQGKVSLNQAIVNLSGLPFEINGFVNTDTVKFNVKSKNIGLEDLVNKLSVGAMDDVKKFNGSGDVSFNLDIEGSTTSEEPLAVNCDFGISKGALTEPSQNLRIKDIQLDGKYSNEGGAEKEFLELKNMKFKTAGGPFRSDVRLMNFENPTIKGKATGTVDLKVAHAVFHFPEVEKISGSTLINADFALQQNESTGSIEVNKCDGDVLMKSLRLKLKGDKRTFENINGNIFLRGNEAGIDNASLKVGATDLRVDGIFRNIFDYLNAKKPLETEVEIESNYLKVEDLGTTTKKEKVEGERIFVLPNDILGSINLTVGTLQYENHRFDHILGKMNIQNHRLHFPQISLVNAEALISGALIIEERTPEIFTITTQVATKNLKFKPMFKEWDNFEQQVITSNNISGRAEADLYFFAPFDLRSGIVLKAIESKLNLKVYDGHLKNVPSFKDITESLKTNSGKLVLGKKNIDLLEEKLKDISFQTLENSIVIKNGIVNIPKMRIGSSAFDMDVSGVHSFDNEIDYRFAFRLRDLMKTEKDSEFGEVIDDGTGIKIFMRMHGTLDKPIIEWDKTSRKEQAKQNREEAKQDAKSILKSEFGLFKNDTTVKEYKPQEMPKEELKIHFGPATKEEFKEVQKEKKDSKLKKTLKNWKDQQNKEGEEDFKVGKGGGR
ncbi:MAG: AsmA-like C-terminal region-containing protein [Crocinitomicaceae bacterium]